MWAHGITALSLCTDHRPRNDLRRALDVSGAVRGATGSIRGTTGLLLEATACFTTARRLKTSRISSEGVCARLPSACEVANRHLPRSCACASIAFLMEVISWSVDSILRLTRKVAKSDYELRYVCLYVRPSVRKEQLGSHWTKSHEYLSFFF
jgi:hypothetical protein